MRITVDIDDDLYEQAWKLAGQDIAPEDLFREALRTFVRLQSAKRLAAQGCTISEMKTAPVYEKDIHAWAYEQARFLRAGRFELLDIAHLAGEIEDIGKREQHELSNCMAMLLAHLLKWSCLPGGRCAGWEKIIQAQRKGIRYVLGESPSLMPKMQESLWLDMVWTRAVAQVVTATGLDCFPDECHWDIQGEVLCDTWLPAK